MCIRLMFSLFLKSSYKLFGIGVGVILICLKQLELKSAVLVAVVVELGLQLILHAPLRAGYIAPPLTRLMK